MEGALTPYQTQRLVREVTGPLNRMLALRSITIYGQAVERLHAPNTMTDLTLRLRTVGTVTMKQRHLHLSVLIICVPSFAFIPHMGPSPTQKREGVEYTFIKQDQH